jgi:hypothetical protein
VRAALELCDLIREIHPIPVKPVVQRSIAGGNVTREPTSAFNIH